MLLIILNLSLLIFSSLADENIPNEKTDESRYQVVTSNINNRQPNDYITYNEANRLPITQEYRTIYGLEGLLNPGYNRQRSGYEENINNRAYIRQQSRYADNINNPFYRQQSPYEENINNNYKQQSGYEENINNRAYIRQQSRYGDNINNPFYRQQSPYEENINNNYRQQSGYEDNIENPVYYRQQSRYGENIDNSVYYRQLSRYGENINNPGYYQQQAGKEENVNLVHDRFEYNQGPYNRQYNNRYRLEGREGLGFDKRTAFALGLRYPLTLELLYSIPRYPNEKPELLQQYQYY